jgi:hypothetical protein
VQIAISGLAECMDHERVEFEKKHTTNCWEALSDRRAGLGTGDANTPGTMKLDLHLSHIFGFFPHESAHAGASKPSPAPATEAEPVLVFRGVRYHQDQIARTATVCPQQDSRLVFRGIPYSHSSANSGLEVAPRPKGVRIFRGNVVR